MREALTRLDISHYLGHQLLRDGDVMSMAHSVEMRVRAASLASKLLDPRAVGHVWDGFLRGRDEWSRPWALYVLSQFEVGYRD
jgi:hypothetical protein